MDIFQAILLAVIQGLSEFLPISSSAHLILPAELFGWPDQGLAFDVAVHVGSLAAVIVYFRSDIKNLAIDWLKSLPPNRSSTPSSLLAWSIIVGTIPAGLAGLLFMDFIEMHLRSILVIAMTTILFALLLGLADRYYRSTKTLDQMTLRLALLVGLAQVLALIPGTSRSGITMTAALALGFDRTAAARFSFLLAIPIIALSGVLASLKLLQQDAVIWSEILIGAALSGVTAYLCIHSFLRFVERVGMMPFVIYRLLLGSVLIFMLWV